jgi:transcriptional regulator with XRE-family HTH domain
MPKCDILLHRPRFCCKIIFRKEVEKLEPTEIGKRIKMLRAYLGMNQTDFAAKIGSAQNTITGYESGRRNPSGQVLELICQTFNVNRKWLLSGEGDMLQPKTSEELDALAKKYGLSIEAKIIIEQFINLDEGSREAVIDYVVRTAENIEEVRGEMEGSSSEDLHSLLDQEIEAQKKVEEDSTSSRSTDGSETRGAG